MNLPSIWGWSIEVKRTVWWTWVQKAGRLDRSLDHGRNPPLFGLLPSSEDRPPAPLPATNYRDTMCVTAWSDSPNEASIGTLSRWGGGGVTLAWLLDHGPNAPFFGLLPPSDGHPPAPLAATHYQDVMCVWFCPIRPTTRASVRFLGGWLIHFIFCRAVKINGNTSQ